MRCRDAEAATNDGRTSAGTLRGETIRDIAKQKIEAVRLLERVQLRRPRIDLRYRLGVCPLDLRTERLNVAWRDDTDPHPVVPRRAERFAFVRHIIERERPPCCGSDG